MSHDSTSSAASSTSAPVKPDRRPRHSCDHLHLDRNSTQARRSAAAVLEVLAGLRAPQQAAQVLGVALPSYYKLESRALRGLVEGCEPPARGRGPARSQDHELAQLRQQCQKLSSEVHRYQALARAAQRTIGLPPPVPSKTPAKGKRRRKPMVRALRALQQIQSAAPTSSSPQPLPEPAAATVSTG